MAKWREGVHKISLRAPKKLGSALNNMTSACQVTLFSLWNHTSIFWYCHNNQTPECSRCVSIQFTQAPHLGERNLLSPSPSSPSSGRNTISFTPLPFIHQGTAVWQSQNARWFVRSKLKFLSMKACWRQWGGNADIGSRGQRGRTYKDAALSAVLKILTETDTHTQQ